MSTTKTNKLLWLRAETKPFEQRTLLAPQVAGQLVDKGYELVVERSAQRIFDDTEYENVGCRMAETHAWHKAPQHAIILGLKELDPNDGPFTRRHVHFAHAFKDQLGWQDTLRQFQRGGGSLYDLEYLTDESGQRIAAFGYWAGFVGAAVAVLAYCEKSDGKKLSTLSAWTNKHALIDSVQSALKNINENPTALVIGALGRCGTGAVELLNACDIKVTLWDQKETKSGGPFEDVLTHDIMVNCVFINAALPPFTTPEHLASAARHLQVISDVSCDPFGKYNPLPIYTECTSMDKPVVEIIAASDNAKSVELIAIDHLPSLLPRESSEHFSTQLFPALLDLQHLDTGTWQRAKKIYEHHLTRLPAEESA